MNNEKGTLINTEEDEEVQQQETWAPIQEEIAHQALPINTAEAESAAQATEGEECTSQSTTGNSCERAQGVRKRKRVTLQTKGSVSGSTPKKRSKKTEGAHKKTTKKAAKKPAGAHKKNTKKAAKKKTPKKPK